MVIVNHISKKRGGKQVLSDISMKAAPGECVGIIGRNGCGKSTFLSILTGIMKADSGEITFFGRNPMKEKGLFSQMCGYVPQKDPLIEDLTVRDNLRIWCRGKGWQEHAFLQRFELADILDKRVSKLSGGMKRRVSIAAAAADLEPILVMDEPCSSLDYYQKEKVYGLIRDFTARKGTVFLCTHDRREMELCSRLYLIEDGTSRETGAQVMEGNYYG